MKAAKKLEILYLHLTPRAGESPAAQELLRSLEATSRIAHEVDPNAGPDDMALTILRNFRASLVRRIAQCLDCPGSTEDERHTIARLICPQELGFSLLPV